MYTENKQLVRQFGNDELYMYCYKYLKSNLAPQTDDYGDTNGVLIRDGHDWLTGLVYRGDELVVYIEEEPIENYKVITKKSDIDEWYTENKRMLWTDRDRFFNYDPPRR